VEHKEVVITKNLEAFHEIFIWHKVPKDLPFNLRVERQAENKVYEPLEEALYVEITRQIFRDLRGEV
jgi:hypothetical protein